MPFTYLPKESVTLCTKVARIFWLSFQTCAYDSGAVMITKLESFETKVRVAKYEAVFTLGEDTVQHDKVQEKLENH